MRRPTGISRGAGVRETKDDVELGVGVSGVVRAVVRVHDGAYGIRLVYSQTTAFRVLRQSEQTNCRPPPTHTITGRWSAKDEHTRGADARRGSHGQQERSYIIRTMQQLYDSFPLPFHQRNEALVESNDGKMRRESGREGKRRKKEQHCQDHRREGGLTHYVHRHRRVGTSGRSPEPRCDTGRRRRREKRRESLEFECELGA